MNKQLTSSTCYTDLELNKVQSDIIQIHKTIRLIEQNPYIPVKPTNKQLVFLVLNCLDAFYGGAAGGGKTIALLIAALLYVNIPGYSAILLRDTYTNLAMVDSIMDVSFQWLNQTDAVWKENKKRWIFPSDATLSFGYLDGPRDHFNYQSSQYQFVGIDEIVNIREHQAKYMFSRMRKRKPETYKEYMLNIRKDINVKQVESYFEIYKQIPLRFRCASNPPSNEQIARGQWVKDKYVDATTKDNETIFISAKMDDNPHLDKDGYRTSLSKLDHITRKQLEDGDWEISAKGRLFDRGWFEITENIPSNCKEVRYWDLAGTEPLKKDDDPCYTVGLKLHKDKMGIYYISSIVRFRKEPNYVEKMVRQTADIDGKKTHIVMEQEPGSSGKKVILDYRLKILSGYTFKGDNPSGKGSKFVRAQPVSSMAESGNIKLLKGHWNKDFLDEIELFPDGKFKDQVDALSGAYNYLNTNHPRIRTI